MAFTDIKGFHPKWAAYVWRDLEASHATWVDRIMTPAEQVAELVLTLLGKVSPVRRASGPFTAESLNHYEFKIKAERHMHGVKIPDKAWIDDPNGVMTAKRGEVALQATYFWANAVIEAMTKASQTPGPLDTYQIHDAHKWSPLSSYSFSNKVQFDLKDALDEMDRPGRPTRPSTLGMRWIIDQISTAFMVMLDEHGEQAHQPHNLDNMIALVPRKWGRYKTAYAAMNQVPSQDGNVPNLLGNVEIIPVLPGDNVGYAFIGNSGGNYGKAFTRVDELTLPVILENGSDKFVDDHEVMLGAKYWRNVGFGRPDEMLEFEVVQSS